MTFHCAHCAIPLADVIGWVQGLLPLVIFLLVLFYMVGEKKLKNQRLAQRKQAMLKQSLADRPRAAAPPRTPRPVRNEEIEEFLRRAAQKRGEPSAQRAAAARAAAKLERPAESAAARRAPGGLRPAKPMVDARSGGVPQSPSSLSQGVSDRLSTKQFDARASELAGDMPRLNQEHEQRLKKFDHQLGVLGGMPATAERTSAAFKAPAGIGAGLVDLLQGKSLQQAFVLSEIFHRPEDRW